MKQQFTTQARETYDERKARLERHAKMIEQQLQTPPKAALELRPKGALRRMGDAKAHDDLSKQKRDLDREIERITKEREQRRRLEKSMPEPSKGMSL